MKTRLSPSRRSLAGWIARDQVSAIGPQWFAVGTSQAARISASAIQTPAKSSSNDIVCGQEIWSRRQRLRGPFVVELQNQQHRDKEEEHELDARLIT